MIKAFVASWVLMAVAVALTAWLLPGVELHGGVVGVLWVSLLLGLVNAFLGTLLKVLTLPFIVLTFGLLALLINTLMLAITAGLSKDLDINSFWTALWAAILISIFSMVFGVLFRRDPAL
jgi:putative membrane protein